MLLCDGGQWIHCHYVASFGKQYYESISPQEASVGSVAIAKSRKCAFLRYSSPGFRLKSGNWSAPYYSVYPLVHGPGISLSRKQRREINRPHILLLHLMMWNEGSDLFSRCLRSQRLEYTLCTSFQVFLPLLLKKKERRKRQYYMLGVGEEKFVCLSV